MGTIDLLINQLLSGVVRGSLYFLITAGLTLLFGVVGTLNMAHFSLYMIASYLTWTFTNVLLKDFQYSYWAACGLAALTMCILAAAIERTVIRHLYRRPMPEQLMVTFSMVYIIDDLAKVIWKSLPLYVAKPQILTRSVAIGTVSFPVAGLFIIILGMVTGSLTWLLLDRTRMGRILRAAYSYKEMVSALGIPLQRVYLVVFVLSVLLASIAGSAWTVIGMVELGQGDSLLIECFCVMVVGGMGSFAGTILSSLLLGLTYSFAILIFPKIATLLIFVLAGIILTARPGA